MTGGMEWFADEAFWEATFPFMFPESRFEAAEREVEQILALTRLTGGSVLDLACGPGRHSMPLAARGFHVIGVDRSAFLLEHARARAAAAGVAVEWVHSDMRAFQRPAAFDLALSLFTSLGYFRDDADNQRVLDHIAASLRAGGVLVLDMIGKEVLARIFAATGSYPIPGGVIVHRRAIIDSWKRIENEWILIEGNRARTFRFAHWLYSGREIERMLFHAGFADVTLYGDYLGTPYGPEAPRLVAVARKAIERSASD